MLSPNDITLHLQDLLPLLTDLFHDELPVSNGVVSGGILTITLPSGHGLVADDQIYINEALIKNQISSLIVNSDDTVSYITNSEHDLTAYSTTGHKNKWPKGLSVTLDDDGTTTEVNLIPDSSGVPNNNEFVGLDGSPIYTIDGNQYLLENRSIGVTGFKTITGVTATTLTIDLSDVPSVPDGPLVMDHILTNVRVAHVVDVNRAEEIYTTQSTDKAWLFVIMTDREPSKDRSNNDDFTSLPNSSQKLLNIRQDFSTLVILPTANKVGATDAKTTAYVDLFVILNKCLHGWKDTGYNGDGQGTYNTSYYAHVYEWEHRIQINFESGYINNKTVALRELDFTQTIFDEGESNGSIEF